MRVWGLVGLALVLLSCGSHTATYRTKAAAEPLARKICFEVGGRGNTEVSPGHLQCVVLHNIEFRVEYRGNLMLIRTPNEHLLAEVALQLGRISNADHVGVELEDVK